MKLYPWYWVLLHNFAYLLLAVAITCKFFMLLLTNKLFKKEFYSILRKICGKNQHNFRRPAVVRNLMVKKRF